MALAGRENRTQTPWPTGVVIVIFILTSTLFVTRQQIPNFLPILPHWRIKKHIIMRGRYRCSITSAIKIFPYNRTNKGIATKYLVANQLQVVSLIIIDSDPQRTGIRQKPPDYLQPVSHHAKPDRVLDAIIIVLEGTAGIV